MEPPSDRRREHRIQSQELIQIFLLGPPGGPSIPGTLLDISGSGLRVLSPRPLPCGVPVRLESPNRLLLGEVLRSDPEGDAYSIGIKVRHALNDLPDLERLNRHLLGEKPEATPVRDGHILWK